MKGGAKSRKKLTKRSRDYGYTAPRLKDGIMTRPSVYTYDPSENIMDRNTAATNMQRRYRGKKSRSKYDLKSNWYKGFPTERPKERLNLEIISRISDAAIQGLDSRMKRDYYDSKRTKISDKYQSELDKLGELDQSKYNWGEFYSNQDLNRRPTREDQELLRFEKKNYETLKKMADKKKYWQQQLEKSGRSSEYTKYDPNRVIDTQRFNIRSYAGDVFSNPENYKEMFEAYYKGRYYDEDIDDYKYLPDYKVEDIPSLSPIKEDDSVEYDSDDELLLPREVITKAVDYYKSRKMEEDKLHKKYESYMEKYNKLEGELEESLKLDIEKCLHAKKLAKTDIKLLQDPFFMENYYKPCSDNENLTEIYIDTFYSLPWELIRPVSTQRFGETIDDMIHNIPTIQWKNGLITRKGQYIFRGILTKQFGDYSKINTDNYFRYRNGHIDAIDTLNLLSNFYRWAKPGNIVLVHLEGKPTIYSNLPGVSQLVNTFNDLDEAFIEKPEEFNNNVEKVKRYFILRLIGIIGNPEYPEILQNFIDRQVEIIDYIKNTILEDENIVKENTEVINKTKNKLKKFDGVDEYTISIKDYDEKDDLKSILFYRNREIETKNNSISINKKKLLKLEKNLETAKRFSRIKGIPKDYMTWEPEKLIYE